MSDKTPGTLAPYQYEMVYVLLRKSLSAYELTCCWPLYPRKETVQGAANSLRPLVKRGWIERSPTGIYRATEKARQAVCW